MKAKNKQKIIKYRARDYLFTIAKMFEPISNAEKFILGDKVNAEIKYKVTLVEFNEEFYLDTLNNVESKVHTIIQEKLDLFYDSNDVESFKKIPIPLQFSNEFTGKLMLRLTPELHRTLFIESKISKLSINKLIEKKLSK